MIVAGIQDFQPRNWKLLIGLAVGILSLVSSRAMAAEAAAPCQGAGFSTICGLHDPEDLQPVSGTDFVIVSGFPPAPLHRINTRTHAVESIANTARVAWSRKEFPGCGEAPDPANMIAHGIAIRQGAKPRLYVIGHRGREAVEVYDIRREDASLTWVGCVPIESGIWANSVTPLLDGRIAITNSGPMGDRTAVLRDASEGKNTGDIRIWSKDGGWTKLAGSDSSATNGLIAHPDGKSLFIATGGTHNVTQVYLDGVTPARGSPRLDILPDNLRWTPEGRIMAAGMRLDLKRLPQCAFDANCTPPGGVIEIDPLTLAPTDVTPIPDGIRIAPPTSALVVGQEIWIGSFRGECIMIFPRRSQSGRP